MRIDVYFAFDAILSHIRPAVSRHPFALAFRTLVFPEASFFALVRSQAVVTWSSLRCTNTKRNLPSSFLNATLSVDVNYKSE